VPGKRLYNFQPPIPTLSATVHIVTDRQADRRTDRLTDIIIVILSRAETDHAACSTTRLRRSTIGKKSIKQKLIFSARQHVCYSALYAIARQSVRPSVTWVDQSKTVEGKITQPSPQTPTE